MAMGNCPKYLHVRDLIAEEEAPLTPAIEVGFGSQGVEVRTLSVITKRQLGYRTTYIVKQSNDLT